VLSEALADIEKKLSEDARQRNGRASADVLDVIREVFRNNPQNRRSILKELDDADYVSDVRQALKDTIDDAADDALQWNSGLSNVLKHALEDKDTAAVIGDALVLAHWQAQGY